MDIFTAFFTGVATGMIFGVIIMAVAVAAGKNREEVDDYSEPNPLYNRDVIVVKNDEEVIKIDDGKYLIKRRK